MAKTVTDEFIQRIINICNRLKDGIYVTEQQLKISLFQAGYLSNIFLIEFLEAPDPSFPSHIVIKFYPEEKPLPENASRQINSQMNSLYIGNAGLGPKVRLVTECAIVMDYIDCQMLIGAHDQNLMIRKQIAVKLAHFHSLKVPIGHNIMIKRIRQSYDRWFSQELEDNIYQGSIKKHLLKNDLKCIINTNLRTESNFVRDQILQISNQSPEIVFAHNDFNHSNIVVEKKAGEIYFIDFELSLYSFRGLDIGRYFVDAFQSEQFHCEDIISDSLMMEFINWYRDEYSKINGNDWNFQINNSSENLLRESKVFCLHAYMIDIIFCMWMASRHLNDSIDVATDFMIKDIISVRKMTEISSNGDSLSNHGPNKTISIIQENVDISDEHRVAFIFVKLHQTIFIWIGDPTSPILDSLALALGSSSTSILSTNNMSSDAEMAIKLSAKLNNGKPVYVAYNYAPLRTNCELKLSVDKALIEFVKKCLQ